MLDFPQPVKYGVPYQERCFGASNIVIDMGGVLMQHNIPGCIAKFKALMGDNFAHLGLGDDGEGSDLMGRYEQGLVSTDEFVASIIKYCPESTTREQIEDAWITMHGGIPQQRFEQLETLLAKGYNLFLLSNSNELHWKDIETRYNPHHYFKNVFLSQEMHMTKPDPGVFTYVKNRIPGAATIFVDDIKANRDAGEQVGWKTFASLDDLLKTL